MKILWKFKAVGVNFLSDPKTLERDKIYFANKLGIDSDEAIKIVIINENHTNSNSDCTSCGSNTTTDSLSTMGLAYEIDPLEETPTELRDVHGSLDTDDFDDHDPNSDDNDLDHLFNLN